MSASCWVGRHGAGRVWLFGSLVAGRPTIESDVDLAAEGLASSTYFSALADLMALFHGPVATEPSMLTGLGWPVNLLGRRYPLAVARRDDGSGDDTAWSRVAQTAIIK
jgi:hypothetical protein